MRDPSDGGGEVVVIGGGYEGLGYIRSVESTTHIHV